MTEKNRLDIVLYERGFVDSREKAKKLIKNGSIMVNGKVVQKAGLNVSDSDVIELCGELMPYVSRGGYKLEKAIKEFGLKLDNTVCMDIGASTGGFTDCMLQNGAGYVYAVDVGTGQLSHKLLNDIRVNNMEQTNFRYLKKENLEHDIGFASVDVSFISLTHILPNMYSILADGAKAVCLIKPQFEAGKENIGKNGIVKDISIHISVVEGIYDLAVSEGFCVLNLDFSPIKGPKGNIEYLIYLEKSEKESLFSRESIKSMVLKSHNELNRGEVL